MRPSATAMSATAAPRAVTTVPPRTIRSAVRATPVSACHFGEGDVLGALPQDDPAELGQLFVALEHGGEVVARELPCLAGEQGRPVRKQDLRFADAAGIQEQVAWGWMARVVLVPD